MSTLLFALVAAAFAVRPADVVPVKTSHGLRLLELRTHDHSPSVEELLRCYRKPPTELRVSDRPVPQAQLGSWYRGEAERIAEDAIRLAVELLRARGIHLAKDRETPVSYVVDPASWRAYSTPGLIATCWACYGAGRNRDLVVKQLGFEAELLGPRPSENPRFIGAQLFRGSASEITVTLRTRERGPVTFSVLLGLDESYHPFVADVPGAGRRLGSSQRLRVHALALFPSFSFGLDHVPFYGADVFSVVTESTRAARLPAIFDDVREGPVADLSVPKIGRGDLRSLAKGVKELGLVDLDRIVIPRGER